METSLIVPFLAISTLLATCIFALVSKAAVQSRRR
jgi:hypothetical protein